MSKDEQHLHDAETADDEADNHAQDSLSTLSQKQLSAVSALAANNKYEHQSSWKTLKELPARERIAFFTEHFLGVTAAVVVVLALIIAFVVSYVMKAPDPKLSVQGFGMANYDSQLTQLRDEFAQSQGVKDTRLIQINGDLNIVSNTTADDSVKTLAMVSAGQINIVVGDTTSFKALNKRGLIAKVHSVLGSKTMMKYKRSWVDAQGRQTQDASKVAGLDLSQAARWKSAGLPADTYIGFSNVQTTQSYAQDFITFLNFAS